MGEKQVKHSLSCPGCGETVLAEDKFCFHCGRRLKSAVPPHPSEPKVSRRHFPQWPLAVAGAMAVVLAVYVIHRENSGTSATVRATQTPKIHAKHQRTNLKPVVSTTTTYPPNLPSSAHWTPEVETYQNVQLSLRVPTSMAVNLGSSATRWVWGKPNTPYRVVMQVVSQKPSQASQSLGPQTFGTSITNSGGTATQSLYISWANHQWVEVQMVVPSSNSNWLGAIAESVRVS